MTQHDAPPGSTTPAARATDQAIKKTDRSVINRATTNHTAPDHAESDHAESDHAESDHAGSDHAESDHAVLGQTALRHAVLRHAVLRHAVLDHAVPAVPGILSAEDVLATGESIARAQEPSGAIGWPDGHIDPWDHIECAMALTACGLTEPARRAYLWLRDTQRADGSWPRATVGARVTDTAAESNHAAYLATGIWHEFLVTGDSAFATAMWPTVRRAIDWVLTLRMPRGEIAWECDATGAAAGYALLTGCSSIHHSLRCAVALAKQVAEPQPDWELAADRLGHVIAQHPEAFADKSSYSMDWYYPILGGPVRGGAAAQRLAAGWDTFVVPGLGVRCVSDEPWVTGAETAELVLALDACGLQFAARGVLATLQHLRHDDGSYWTGWQFANKEHFPDERSTWTAAAVILAADALSNATPAAPLFKRIP